MGQLLIILKVRLCTHRFTPPQGRIDGHHFLRGDREVATP